MDTIQKEQIEILTTLTRYCNDSHSGYSDLADRIEDDELETIFNRLGQQRKLFAEELNLEIIALGGDRVTDGSTEGFIHNSWLKIKSLVGRNENDKLIKTSLDGEEFIANRYAENLTNKSLPSFLREKLIKQYSFIKGAHTQIQSFSSAA